MIDYRVYFIGGDDHIFAAENIEAANDAAAIAIGARLCAEKPECHAIEIWQQTRRVHRRLAEAAD